LVAALLKETELQKDYLGSEPVKTIYIGGGTPSLLQIEDLRLQIDKIKHFYPVSIDAEVTLEANPDDITEELLNSWKETGINRLSIGIQSFFEEDLKWMNRAHNAQQAIDSLQMAIKQFSNITIDLIYGYPLLSDDKWKRNIEKAIAFSIPHLSCYALTVEPKTPLHKMIREHKTEDVNPGKQSDQFLLLMQWMEKGGYEHYEISNFAKPGFRSRHNSSYWQGEKYLGIGPSAHSFDGSSRQWNISNNTIYTDSINKGLLPSEKELLTPTQKLNEYIMTSLRTIEGLDLKKLDKAASLELQTAGKRYIDSGKMIINDGKIILTKEGKLFADGIAADLFLTDKSISNF